MFSVGFLIVVYVLVSILGALGCSHLPRGRLGATEPEGAIDATTH
jgi:hypothetical protein